MKELVYGECEKHPGHNMINCNLCSMEKNHNFDKFIMNESIKPAYCGLLVLNNKELLRLVKDLDSSWERIAHHMTIKMGGLPEEYASSKGNIDSFTVTHIGRLDDKVVAVKVDTELFTFNKNPHITLAVNRKNGGKPVMSNNITEWTKLDKPIVLKGKIAEFAQDGKEI